MQKHSLSTAKRETFGKKVKKLRREGILPANIYGKDFDSTAVQVEAKAFLSTFAETGHSGLIELKLDGKTIPTLVHEVTYDHVNQFPLHIDFYKVNLKEKVKAVVPVHLVGEPQAITEKLGLLMHNLSEVEVEALPTDLPEAVEVDVTHLAQVGDSVKVADMKVSPEVTILNDPEQEVARISELVSREAEEQAAAEAEAQEAAAAESAEGEVPAEGGEKPTEEAPAEK